MFQSAREHLRQETLRTVDAVLARQACRATMGSRSMSPVVGLDGTVARWPAVQAALRDRRPVAGAAAWDVVARHIDRTPVTDQQSLMLQVPAEAATWEGPLPNGVKVVVSLELAPDEVVVVADNHSRWRLFVPPARLDAAGCLTYQQLRADGTDAVVAADIARCLQPGAPRTSG